MLNFEKYQEELKKAVNEKDNGKSQEEVLIYLKEHNFSVMDAIKLASGVYNVSLAHGKEMVYGSPAWEEKVKLYEDYHRDLMKSLESFGKE